MSAVADLQQAEALDREGRHDQAIEALARAARGKDAEAMTRLAKRLLVGDRAPALPKDGVGLMLDAAQLGNAEAAARLAVLFAIGFHQEQNWHAAAECLMVAAQRGWQPARAQLQVLAEDRELAARATGQDGADIWRQLVEDIDFDYWLREPAGGRNLNEKPLVRSYANFAPPRVCDWIISRVPRPRLRRAEVWDTVKQRNKVDQTRTNSAFIFDMTETDLVNVLVQAKMAASTGLPFRHLEAGTVLHYAPGEQITEHFDFVNPDLVDYQEEIRRRGQRVVTFLLYLNDDYRDGETEFPALGVRHRGRRGDAVFFVNSLPDGSPDRRTRHAGRPPREGEKWIVSQFIRNRPTF